MCVLWPFIDTWNPIHIRHYVFQTGVFSATVAAFLIESYKSLKPDPTDISSKLLIQITQELAGISNGARLTPSPPDPFQVPRYIIHVNILWFLSLTLSLGCGLGATLVQQWARRYLRLTKRSDTLEKRVRIREFLWSGVQDLHVNWVVESVALMLHAAIFLFFVGLVEFLFAINDEVADVILVAVSIFAAIYITLTLLPLFLHRSPFQTPLTSILWSTGHALGKSFVYPFSRFRKGHKNKSVRDNFKGFDIYLMDTMENNKVYRYLDKQALKSTLSMCRDEGDLEAFIDAIPGYLQQADDDDGTHTKVKFTRINDIGSLLKPEEKDPKKSALCHRFEDLFTSCTHNHKSMDQGSRRRRAITCSRAIWEMSKASLSSTRKGMTFELHHLPKSTGDTLHRLTSDTDSAIAASAQRTMAVFKRAIMEHVLHTKPRTDDDGSKDSLTAEAIGDMNIPLFPLDQAGERHGGLSGERLNTVTEFMWHILAHIKHSEQPSPLDLEETRMTLKELCSGLIGREFPHADQQGLVKVLSDVSQAQIAQLASGSATVSTGTLYPWYPGA
jgi:hypothetical protein